MYQRKIGNSNVDQNRDNAMPVRTNIAREWVLAGAIGIIILSTVISKTFGMILCFFVVILLIVPAFRKRDITVWLPWILISAAISLSAVGQHAQMNDVARDLLNFAVFPVFLFAGLFIARLGIGKNTLFLTTLAAVIIHTFYVAKIGFSAGASGLTRDNYRALVGYCVPEAIFLIPLCVDYLFSKNILYKIAAILGFIFCGVSIYVTDSRTQLAVSVVAIIIRLFNPSPFWKKAATSAALSFVLFLGTPLYSFCLGPNLSEQLREIAPGEIVEWMPFPYSNIGDINKRWRAYEGDRAFNQWLSNDTSRLIFGEGAGAVASLGLRMKLGGGVYETVPIMHNGLAYAALKAGLLGLIYIFIITLTTLKLVLSERNGSSNNAGFVCALYSTLTFPVTSGFFNAGQSTSLILLLWGASVVTGRGTFGRA